MGCATRMKCRAFALPEINLVRQQYILPYKIFEENWQFIFYILLKFIKFFK